MPRRIVPGRGRAGAAPLPHISRKAPDSGPVPRASCQGNLATRRETVKQAQGMTLMELLVALALLAILAALATPALESLRLNASRAAVMEGLLRAAWYARSEAVRQGRPVVLCPAGPGDACTARRDAWSGGWTVAAAATPDAPLRTGHGVGRARAVLMANRDSFTFETHDRRSTNGTLAWCDPRGERASRAIVISPTGRPRLQRGSGSIECSPP
jgi:type IV fimbrial biogenesis protein FimT